jgi:hypothetical protein
MKRAAFAPALLAGFTILSGCTADKRNLSGTAIDDVIDVSFAEADRVLHRSIADVFLASGANTVVSASPTTVSKLTCYESDGRFGVQPADAKRLQVNGLIMTEPGHGLDVLRHLASQLRSRFGLTEYEIRAHSGYLEFSPRNGFVVNVYTGKPRGRGDPYQEITDGGVLSVEASSDCIRQVALAVPSPVTSSLAQPVAQDMSDTANQIFAALGVPPEAAVRQHELVALPCAKPDEAHSALLLTDTAPIPAAGPVISHEYAAPRYDPPPAFEKLAAHVQQTGGRPLFVRVGFIDYRTPNQLHVSVRVKLDKPLDSVGDGDTFYPLYEIIIYRGCDPHQR